VIRHLFILCASLWSRLIDVDLISILILILISNAHTVTQTKSGGDEEVLRPQQRHSQHSISVYFAILYRMHTHAITTMYIPDM